MTAFYRLHDNPAAPCFCVEHAYSGLWGAEWDADGSRAKCGECDGTGRSFGETCRSCGGECWDDAQEGYSCCATATDLVTYMQKHGGMEDGAVVVVFEGTQVGTGFDGEPLAVPTGDVRWITWGQLVALAQEENR